MSHSSPDTRVDRLIRIGLMVVAGLLVLTLIGTIVLFATAPRSHKAPASTESGTVTDTNGLVIPPAPSVDDGVTLKGTPDAGKAYQDSLTFVGDSLTAHLVSRGVLTDGQATKQVWKTENNMLNLNSEINSQKIIYPKTGEKMTVAEAAKKDKPAILIITLGTDWGVAYLTEKDFKSCYGGFVREIQAASPKTKIILQSIFPVTETCKILDNKKIDTANGWVKAVAADTGCAYLDTQSILKDEKGHLRADYCNSQDGIHLSADAYKEILKYIRTHAYTK